MALDFAAPAPALIFEHFQRATDDRQDQNLGLGLYIVGQTLAQHGGNVAVASQPRQGSTFTVQLPLAQAAAAT